VWWCMILVGVRIAIAVAGFILIVAGIGIKTTRGARRFIMVVGLIIRATAGAGGRIRSGARRGFRGVPAENIVAGHRCRRYPFIVRAWAFTIAAQACPSGLILV
jgi:hypothetical protein